MTGTRRLPIRTRRLVVVLLLAVVAMSVAFASGIGPVENAAASNHSSATEINSCQVISQPGTYVLNDTLEGYGAGLITHNTEETCLAINTSDVVIYGATETIEGPYRDSIGGSGSEIGIKIGNKTRTISNITVENLTVTKFAGGIRVKGGDDVHIDNIDAEDNNQGALNIRASENVTISNTYLFRNGWGGDNPAINFYQTSNSTIHDNRIVTSSHYAVDLKESHDNHLSNNFIDQSGKNFQAVSQQSSGGVFFESSDRNALTDNEITAGGNAGTLHGVVIGDTPGGESHNNTIGNVSSTNTISGFDGSGIWIKRGSTGTTVQNTDIQSNVGDQVFVVGNGTALLGNTIDPGFESSRGVFLDASYTFIVKNTITSGTEGIYIEDRSGTLRNVSINLNTVESNDNAGIYVDSGTNASAIEAHGNTIGTNGAYGIDNQNNSILNATNNDWGTQSGIQRPSTNLAATGGTNITDPLTGDLANGTGSNVTEDPNTAGVSNVHFANGSGSGPIGNGSGGGAFVDVAASDLTGNGTVANPYVITNASELQAMEDNLTANYTLGADIDATGTANWNNGSGFDPVGNDTSRFNGSLHGQNHVISGLSIARHNTNYVGLFGATGSGTEIDDVDIADVNISGDRHVGGLAGSNGGSINASSVSGEVTGTLDVGGLVGINAEGFSLNGATIRSSSASGNVSGTDLAIGGLVGQDENGHINLSSAATDVSGGNANEVGGLLGHADGTATTITSSSASGTVNSSGSNVGGLVGKLGGDLNASSATGNVTGVDNTGGLVGKNTAAGSIERSSASGHVESVANSNDFTGGLVGENSGTITSSHATGSVTGSESGTGLAAHGGLAGQNSGTITLSYATGAVDGSDNVGGLTGQNKDTITTSYATGAVNGSNSVGGFVGTNDGSLINTSYAVGNVTGSGSLGGFVGTDTGTVNSSYWDTETTTQSTSAGNATGLTTAQMTGQAAETNMTGLAFGTVWQTQSNDYPILFWQAGGAPGGGGGGGGGDGDGGGGGDGGIDLPASPGIKIFANDLAADTLSSVQVTFNATDENVAPSDVELWMYNASGSDELVGKTTQVGSTSGLSAIVVPPNELGGGAFTARAELVDNASGTKTVLANSSKRIFAYENVSTSVGVTDADQSDIEVEYNLGNLDPANATVNVAETTNSGLGIQSVDVSQSSGTATFPVNASSLSHNTTFQAYVRDTNRGRQVQSSVSYGAVGFAGSPVSTTTGASVTYANGTAVPGLGVNATFDYEFNALDWHLHPAGDPSNREIGTVAGVDSDTELQVTVTVEHFDPLFLVGSGNATDWETTSVGTNSTNVTFDVTPAEADWDTRIRNPDPFEWPLVNGSATTSYDAIVDMKLFSLRNQGTGRERLRGGLIASDAQAFAPPVYTPPSGGNPGSLDITVASPHYEPDGTTVSTGFYRAIIPSTVISDWGVQPSQLTATYQGKRTSLSVEQLSDGSVRVFTPIQYSSGTVSVTGQTSAPQVTRFEATNPSGQEIDIVIDVDRELNTITVDLRGPESATLSASDFNQTANQDGSYTYTADYTVSTDGSYTVELQDAVDTNGTGITSTLQDSVTVSSGTGQNISVSTQLDSAVNNVGAPVRVGASATHGNGNLARAELVGSSGTVIANESCSGGSCQGDLEWTPAASTWNGSGYGNATLTVRVVGQNGQVATSPVETDVYIEGDTNGDGTVNIFDAVTIGQNWRASTNSFPWPTSQQDAADLNNDGTVNIFDAVTIGQNWRQSA